MKINLREYFTAVVVTRILRSLPPIFTVVMDWYYPDRPQHPFAVIGLDEIRAVAQVVPVVKRGAPSVPLNDATMSRTYIEPLPVRPSMIMTAKDLNDLQLLDSAGREQWTRKMVEQLRRSIRWTNEALAAQSLTGSISHPIQLQGGAFDTYTVDYGDPLSHTVDTAWNADGAKIAGVYDTLDAMETLIQDQGWGSRVQTLAGKAAFSSLVGLAENFKSTAKMTVEVREAEVVIGGYSVKKMARRYRHPQTGAMTPIVGDNQVVMADLDGGQQFFYCAVDDLKADLQPLPMFVKPVEIEDPSGWKVIGESKPLPAPNVKAICWADVVED